MSITTKLITKMRQLSRIYDINTMLRTFIAKVVWDGKTLVKCNKWDKANNIECYAEILDKVKYCGVVL